MQCIVLVPGGGIGSVVTATQFCSCLHQDIMLYIRQVKLILYWFPHFPAWDSLERLSRLKL
jgi:hypothetical protein